MVVIRDIAGHDVQVKLPFRDQREEIASINCVLQPKEERKTGVTSFVQRTKIVVRHGVVLTHVNLLRFDEK